MSLRIIAEAGENHLGDINRALEMVHLAAGSKVDFIKFQSYSEEDLADSVPLETRKWIQRTQLSLEDHHRLQKEAQNQGIKFLSTAVNVKWAKILRDMGCKVIKLASLSLTNKALLCYVGEYFQEVFISTGMGNVEEIEKALSLVGKKSRVTLLHCVSQYPVTDRQASLKSICYLRDWFKVPVGYSDHTIGILACFAAVALGAEVIEKHFTLDKTLEGTDHILSADPSELAQIAYGCRRIASMLGQFAKEPTEGELKNSVVMRTLFKEVTI